MIYQNPRTGMRIDLLTLNDDEQKFYRAARQRFDDGVPWFDFDDFAFGSGSPLYRGRASHHEVLQHPLYIALKDMWLELGVRQGRIRTEPVALQGVSRLRSTQPKAQTGRNSGTGRPVQIAAKPAGKFSLAKAAKGAATPKK
jgi:hypothetical protein